MNTITVKRKQRLAEARKKRAKARNRKIVAGTMAGAVSALFLMGGKAGACSADYTVKKNDTLYILSKKYGVSVEQLKEANGLSSDKIFAGQQMLVPDLAEGNNVSIHTVQKGETLFSLAQKFHITVNELKKKNQLQSDQIKVGQGLFVPIETAKYEDNMYTVVPGDTLWGIADRFGISVKDLAKENGLREEMVLIGQRLAIPGEIHFSMAKVVGAADKFTVEFDQQGKPLVLKVPYGAAGGYQEKSGKMLTVVHKNGAVIRSY